MAKKPLTRRSAELLLAAVILARSSSYLFSKLALQGMDKFNLLGLRFLIAFLFLLLIFPKRLRHISRRTILSGLAMGAAFFIVMASQLTALRTTASSTVSFLVNTSIVLVPLLNALLLRRWPSGRALLCAGLALAGVGLLTLGEGLSAAGGIPYCLLSAAFYAVAIVLTDRCTHHGADPLAAGMIQVGFIGVLAMAASFVFESPRLPASGGEWAIVLMLAIVCSGFGFTLQPVAQSGTTAERASMFCALNPLSAAVLGAVVLHEQLGLQSLFGALLILGAIVLSSHKKETAPRPAQAKS